MTRLLCQEGPVIPALNIGRKILNASVHGQVLKVISRFVADQRDCTKLFDLLYVTSMLWHTHCYPRLIDLKGSPWIVYV